MGFWRIVQWLLMRWRSSSRSSRNQSCRVMGRIWRIMFLLCIRNGRDCLILVDESDEEELWWELDVYTHDNNDNEIWWTDGAYLGIGTLGTYIWVCITNVDIRFRSQAAGHWKGATAMIDWSLVWRPHSIMCHVDWLFMGSIDFWQKHWACESPAPPPKTEFEKKKKNAK